MAIPSDGPAVRAVAVTPDDTTPIEPCRGLYIGVSGDVVVHMADQRNQATSTAVTFKSAPVGVLPVGVYRVLSTGTTATNILALY